MMEPPTAEDVAFLDLNTGGNYGANDYESAGQYCLRLDMGPNYYTSAFNGTFTIVADIDIGGDETDLTVLAGTIAGSGNLYVATSLTLLAGVDFSGHTGTICLDGVTISGQAITCNGEQLPDVVVVGGTKAYATDALV